MQSVSGHSADMQHLAPMESTAMTTLPFWGGVEVLRAQFITQRFSKHFHEGFAVGCIEAGAMRFHYKGEAVTAARGQVNLVVPGEPHDGHKAAEEGWAYRMFYLPSEALLEAAGYLMRRPNLPNFRSGVLTDPAMAACIGQTHRILERPETPMLEKETRLMWLLAHWISRHADERGAWSRHGAEHRAVKQAEEILRARFAEDISLTDLAREVRLSPFHLVRVFEKHLGVTPHAYLTQARVEHARHRLAGKDRLADIAADCGFADQAHLTRLFKRQTGVTPGKYRKFIQNN